MSGDMWDHKYVKSGKLRRKLTPQMKALEKRRKAGLRMAKPDETQARVRAIYLVMKEGRWTGRGDVVAFASLWSISESRVEQLAAEAKRALAYGV